MIELPQLYQLRMQELLKDDYQKYLDSFKQKRIYSLRVNEKKLKSADFQKISPFLLEQINWCPNGFYFNEEDRPSKHPYYYAGLYYLQEASAMLPGSLLTAEDGDLILDLCSAPGGKGTQLAQKNDNAIVFCNDISASRNQATIRNIEKLGLGNCYVLSEDPQKLKDRFRNTFDKIICDAPCSGEGMFRKDSDLIKSWQEKNYSYYAPIQYQILSAGIEMLKEGGQLVYSTCTFAKEENEDIIDKVINDHPDLQIITMKRLYPFEVKGEGHFVCLLQKGQKQEKERKLNNDLLSLPADEFFKHLKFDNLNYQIESYNDNLYFSKKHHLDLKGLRIQRSGLLVGSYKNKRFSPSTALALALKKEDFDNVIDLNCDDERVIRYLKGETIKNDKEGRGYILICVDSFPLGFGLCDGIMIKNKYEKSMRYL